MRGFLILRLRAAQRPRVIAGRCFITGRPMAYGSAAVLLTLAALAAAADVLSANLFQYGATQQDLLHAYARPALDSPAQWFGQDELEEVLPCASCTARGSPLEWASAQRSST